MNKDISDQQLLATLKRLERIADLSDSRFRIPFTKIRFGLDAIIGLVPFIGDFISLILSLYLLFEASKLGAPLTLKIKILWNVLIDWLIGLIPVLGDAVDVFFKANNRNMKLLVEHINEDYQSRNVSPKPEETNKISKFVFILAALALASLSLYYSLMLYKGL